MSSVVSPLSCSPWWMGQRPVRKLRRVGEQCQWVSARRARARVSAQPASGRPAAPRGLGRGGRTVVGEDDAFFGERRDVLRPGGRGRVVDPRVVIAQVVLRQRQRQRLREAGRTGAGGGGSTCRMEMMWGFDPASGGPPAAAAASATAASMTVLGSKKGPGALHDHQPATDREFCIIMGNFPCSGSLAHAAHAAQVGASRHAKKRRARDGGRAVAGGRDAPALLPLRLGYQALLRARRHGHLALRSQGGLPRGPEADRGRQRDAGEPADQPGRGVGGILGQ